MVNFYIVNVLGQNLANPESCPILYSENVVRGSGKSVISGNLSRDGYVWATQWPTSIEIKIKFVLLLDRSWCKFLKIIKKP